MRDELAERTIEPTRRRMIEARREGNVARSSDLSAAIMTIGGFVLAGLFAPGFMSNLERMVGLMLGESQSALADTAAIGRLLWDGVAPVLGTLGGFLLSLAVLAVLANIVQVGFLAAPGRVKPDWSRISLAGGWKRFFSDRTTVRLMMACGKLIAVVWITFATIRSEFPEMVTASGMSTASMASVTGGLLWSLGLRIGLALLAIAVVDYLFQRWRHRSDLKMTRREFMDELKQTQGDPAVRSRRAELAKMFHHRDAEITETNNG